MSYGIFSSAQSYTEKTFSLTNQFEALSVGNPSMLTTDEKLMIRGEIEFQW